MVINNVVKDLDVNYLAIDNVKGGIQAVEYLAGLGHKRIATITGNLQTQSGSDRFEGFQKGVLELRDVVFFMVMIGFSLFTTSVIIRSHRAG